MRKVKQLSIATAVALSAATSGALADPVFGDGLNKEFFNNFENNYRLLENCTPTNPCFAVDPNNDPAGYAKPVTNGTPVTEVAPGFYVFDPTSTTTFTENLLVGDLFAGILNVQNIEAGGSTTWFAAADDQFTGYFVQQVEEIILDEVGDLDHINLGIADADPFGILTVADGEMIRLYADDGTPFESSGTTFDDITKATDGDFWAALGLFAADANDLDGLNDPTGTMTDGYAYSHIDIQLDFDNFSDQETFLALNVVTLGDAYNKGPLTPINDSNEAEIGGEATPPVNGVCLPTSLDPILCTQFVGTGELESNDESILLGGSSPWLFASNDPFVNYRTPVPAPATLALFGLGLLGLSSMRRQKKQR